MAFVTGTDFTFGTQTGFVTGTNFVFDNNNYSQISSGTVTLVGDTLQSSTGITDNSSQLTTGTVALIGQSLTSYAPEHNISNLTVGTVTFIGNILQSAVSNLLGVDAYSISIQGTQDLYYLSDSMSGFAIDAYPFHESDISEDLVGHTLLVNNSRATHTHTILGGGTAPGAIDYSYLSDFYNRIHLSTYHLSLGNVLAEELLYVDIWNSYFVSKDLSSIDNINLTDIVLTTPFAVPSTFQALQNFTMSVNISVLGSPTIDGSFVFNFPSESVILILDGQRIILWPFAPTLNYSETRSYLTDILPSKTKETRYALRERPRTTLRHNFIFRTKEEHSQAIAMADKLAQYPLGIPQWSDIEPIEYIAAASSTIYFDTSLIELIVDEPIVIYHSYNNYEIVQIAAVFPTYITLAKPTVVSHTNCWIIPVHVGAIQGGINFSYTPYKPIQCSLETIGTMTYTSAVWPGGLTYNGIPILPTASIVSGGLRDTYDRQQETFDSVTGLFGTGDKENYNRGSFTISLASFTRQDLWNLRRQFDYLQGKYNKFWLPSFQNDINAIGNIIVSSLGLHIEIGFWDRYPPAYIRCAGKTTGAFPEDTTAIFKISSVTNNLDGTAYMVFDVASTVELHDITKVEVMKLVRLDTDSIEYNHQIKKQTTVKAIVKEILT